MCLDLKLHFEKRVENSAKQQHEMTNLALSGERERRRLIF